ncbi:hypothetical protein BDV12DRAFT_192070 [Aspergillus spectabilis]
MKLSILVTLLPILYPVVQGAVLTSRDPLEGYTIKEPEWEIEVSPGVMITARGTIQQVHEAARKVNPDWDAELEERLKAKRALEEEEGQTVSDISRRDVDFEKDGRVKCGVWEEAGAVNIMDGIRYLEEVEGRPTMGPGPGECSRVSCSWDDAIFWCNDTRDTKTLRSFKDIAIGASAIYSKCTYNSNGPFQSVSGQAFHDTKGMSLALGRFSRLKSSDPMSTTTLLTPEAGKQVSKEAPGQASISMKAPVLSLILALDFSQISAGAPDRQVLTDTDPRTGMSATCHNIRSTHETTLSTNNPTNSQPNANISYTFVGQHYATCPVTWFRGAGCRLSSNYLGGRLGHNPFLADYNASSSSWGEIHSKNTCESSAACCVAESPMQIVDSDELWTLFPGYWPRDVTSAYLFDYTHNKANVWLSELTRTVEIEDVWDSGLYASARRRRRVVVGRMTRRGT